MPKQIFGFSSLSEKKDHEAESEGENKSKKTLEFVPNVIVKVESDKATTRKALQVSCGQKPRPR